MTDPSRGKSAPLKLMIVEDDDTFRHVLELLFCDQWQVRALPDAEAALRELQVFHPDLVLTDLRLPGMDGAELALAMRANPRTASTPVIVMSGVTEPEARRRALQSGALDFLSKPIAEEELKLRVAAIAATAAQHRREAEEAAQRLRDSEARFAAAFHSARVGLEVTTVEGTILEINDRYCAIVGRRREELVGRPASELAGREIQDAGAADVDGVEQRLTREDGAIVWIRVTSSLAERSDGGVQRVSVVEDVSDRYRVQRALAASEETFRRVADALTDRALITLDVEGRVSAWNDAAAGLTGYASADILGSPVTRIYARKDSAEPILGKAAVAGTVFEQGWCTRKDGSRFWCDVAVVALFDVGEGLRGYAFVARDLSERKRQEEEREVLLQQARAASRARDQFLATLSHELRTPLHAIMGWAHLLKSSEVDEPTRARAASIIERNAVAQAKLVNDVLELSALMAGRVKPSFADTDLGEVLGEVVDQNRQEAARKRVSLGYTLESEPPGSLVIQGDRERLGTLFGSLVGNAVKFTPSGGSVHVRGWRESGSTRVSVSDTGPGFPPEYISRAFTPFEQADGSSTREHGGLGMGLAIVKHLVDLHRGTVDVSNNGPGGATVTVSLPADRAGQPVAPDADLPRLRGCRVLVVEDHEDSREFLSALLARQGAEVLSAASAEAALALLAGSTVDVIVSDIGMPGKSGLDFMRAYRSSTLAEQRQVPSVAVTAWDRPADREAAVRAGFQAHVSKPVDGDDLINVIARLWRQLEATAS